jgi:hypothetical protein
MPVTEPPIPDPIPDGNLLAARDVVVEQVQAWMGTTAAHDTIGHAGKVSPEFIRQQAGMAPRSIITVLGGTTSRLGGRMAAQLLVNWAWFIIVRGIIEDRTAEALRWLDGAARFVYADVFTDARPDIFSRPPEAGSVEVRSLYTDGDERTGYSVWSVTWEQEITLGPPGRPRPGDGALLLQILGTNTIDGNPPNSPVGDDGNEVKIT